jgi:hypothetical protein
MLSLSGCGGDLLNSSTDFATQFEGDVQVEANDKKYEFKIFHTPEGMSTITFSKPDDIKGLTFSWESGKYTVSMKNLSGEFNTEPLADDSFIACIIKVLNSLNDKENLQRISEEEGEKTFKGECENTDFEITVNKKGEIIRILVPEPKIVANFKYS